MLRKGQRGRIAMIRPGRALVGWAVGVLMTLGLITGSGGWYEYRWYPSELCEDSKASSINVGGFEVVPGQSDLCYLRRPRIRPWQWASGVDAIVRAIRDGI
jgi:hypothetical protein